jgi:predicted RNase H-like HicB family nuclease
MKYAVVYEKTGTGYSAYVPDLPGCIMTGRTRKETERLMKEAIEFHLAGMREDGLSLPESTTTVKKAPEPWLWRVHGTALARIALSADHAAFSASDAPKPSGA